jgi:hypothetical protein
MRFAYDLKRDEAGLHQSQVRTVNGEVLRPQDQHRFDECRRRLGHLAPASQCSDQPESTSKGKLHYGNVRRPGSPSTVVTSRQLFDE